MAAYAVPNSRRGVPGKAEPGFQFDRDRSRQPAVVDAEQVATAVHTHSHSHRLRSSSRSPSPRSGDSGSAGPVAAALWGALAPSHVMSQLSGRWVVTGADERLGHERHEMVKLEVSHCSPTTYSSAPCCAYDARRFWSTRTVVTGFDLAAG